MKFFNRN